MIDIIALALFILLIKHCFEGELHNVISVIRLVDNEKDM